MKKGSCLTIILLLYCQACLYSQLNTNNWFFRELNQDRGLPVSTITCMAQDKDGYLWFGSNEGLFRYDGYGYKNYYYQPGKKDVLPGNRVSCIYVDSDGYIWIGTYQGGLVQMTANSQEFYVYNSQSDNSFSRFSDRVTDIKEDNNKNIWCATGDGLFRIDKRAKTSRVFRHETNPGLIDNIISNLSFDSRHNCIWFGTVKGIQRLDLGTGMFFSNQHNPEHLTILDDHSVIYKIQYDSLNRKIWYSTWEPANKVYDVETNSISVFLKNEGKAHPGYEKMGNCFFNLNKSEVWMTTSNGIYSVDITKPVMIYLPDLLQTNLQQVLKDPYNQLIRLKDSSVWFAGDKGIVYATQNAFTNYQPGKKSHYFEGQLQFVKPVSNNRFLLGTYGSGLFIADSNFVVQQRFVKNNQEKDALWCIVKSSLDGNYYIGGQKIAGIFNEHNNSLTEISIPPFNNGKTISNGFEGDDGWLWFCNYQNTFFKYNPVSHQYRIFDITSMGYPSQIINIDRAEKGAIWIMCNKSGLAKFDVLTENIVAFFKPEKPGGNTIEQAEMSFIKPIAAHQYLIGYESKGLSIYDQDNNRFTHFNKANGLLSSSVTGAVINGNTAWLSTGNGLSKFDLDKKIFENFGYSEGVVNPALNNIFLIDTQVLIAGTNTGFLFTRPGLLKKSTNTAIPVITGIGVFGKKITNSEVLNGNTRLTAGFNDKLISFEFLSLDFLKQPQIRYMYRLEGFDKDWQNLNNRNRTATYTNLAPGDYRFFVRSSEDGINWTICKKPVLVTVQNIFYRTWWFNLLVILSVCSLLYLVYKYRINQLIKVEQMRSAISSDLHDEIGATLSSISIFSQMAKSLAKTNPRQSAEVLDRIGSRSREMVEGMSDIVWSINPANDDIEKTLLRMRTYAFEMSEATNARLSWEIPEAFNKLKLGMEQRKNFYLIFKEAFNNVIKYAEAKNISIRVHLLKSRIDFLIADDGRGFDPETVKKGNGLSNMHKRAEQLNGNLQILSSPEKGTSIHLQFPL